MEDTHATMGNAATNETQFSSSELIVFNLRSITEHLLTSPKDAVRASMIEQAIEQIEHLEAKLRRLRFALEEANQRAKYALANFERFKSDIRTKAAIAALQGLLANPDEGGSMTAQGAVWHADKLVAELEKEVQA